jgi:hypothetical protein
VAFAAWTPAGASGSGLYTINLSTGAATFVGTIGGEQIRGLAVAPPTIRFSSGGFRAREDRGVAEILVTRKGGSFGMATVDFSISDWTARAGLDFRPTTQTLTFADGETQKRVLIRIFNETRREQTEMANLTLSNITGGIANLGDRSTAVLSILDDDLARR